MYRVWQPIALSELQVREAPGGRDDNTFQIKLAYPRGGDVINLRATSVRDAHLWMTALESASRECRKTEKAANTNSDLH